MKRRMATWRGISATTTAYVLGRVSLNPLRHIDPVGTILVPLLILLVSFLRRGAGMLFGWAKPVPVDFSALRHPKRRHAVGRRRRARRRIW